MNAHPLRGDQANIHRSPMNRAWREASSAIASAIATGFLWVGFQFSRLGQSFRSLFGRARPVTPPQPETSPEEVQHEIQNVAAEAGDLLEKETDEALRNGIRRVEDAVRGYFPSPEPSQVVETESPGEESKRPMQRIAEQPVGDQNPSLVPQVNFSFREQAGHISAQMRSGLEEIVPEERALEAAQGYLFSAMKRLFSDQISPPLYQGEKLDLDTTFITNQEQLFQAIMREWIPLLPDTYRAPGQTFLTQRYIYRCLEQLFGPASAQNKQALSEAAAKLISDEILEQINQAEIITPEDENTVEYQLEFIEGIAANIAACLHQGCNLEPLLFTGQPLQFSPALTEHQQQIALKTMTLRIFESLQEKVEHLSPIQKEELQIYIKRHLYQIYGKDTRAIWGRPDKQEERAAEILIDILYGHLDLGQLPEDGTPESDAVIMNTQHFLRRMIEQVSLMPLGHVPELPERIGSPLPLIVNDPYYTRDPQFADVWDPYREASIDKMVDAIMSRFGHFPDREQTRAYIHLCLAELHGVKLQSGTLEDLKKVIGKPIAGWALSHIAAVKEPLTQAAVADIGENTASIVAKLLHEIYQDALQMDNEERRDGSPLIASVVEQVILPGLIDSLQNLYDDDIAISPEKIRAWRDAIADSYMKIIFPNGPQDVPVFRPGNLEAIPEAVNAIGLLKKLETLHSPKTRSLLGFLFGADRVDLTLDRAIETVCAFSDKELQDLEEKGIMVTEGIRAAAEVIRRGGENVHVRAYQIFLYVAIQRTIDAIVIEEFLLKLTDPRIQRQRFIGFARNALAILRHESEDATFTIRATGHSHYEETAYYTIAKQLFESFMRQRTPNKIIHKIGKEIVARSVCKISSALFDNLTISDLVKPSLEGTAKLLQEKSGKTKPAKASWWWPEPPSKEISDQELEDELTAVVHTIRNELFRQWENSGALSHVAASCSVRVASHLLRTDREFNQLIEEFIQFVLQIHYKATSVENVLTLKQRTLEHLIDRRSALT